MLRGCSNLAINIIIGNTPNDKMQLTKSFTNTTSYSCELINDCDVVNPSVIISTSNNLSAHNYARIEAFGRYYYITKITVLKNGLWLLDMKCDVLMSYNSQIKALPCVLERQTYNANTYIPDSEYMVQSKTDIVQKKFPNSLNTGNSIILITNGG